MLAANRRLNLTAITEPHEFWRKQIIDSLEGLADAGLSGGMRVLDVGSGCGVPGVPLCLVQTGLDMTLLDASLRKVRFLQGVCAELGLQVRAVHGRAEGLGREAGERGAYERVLAKAVAPLRVLLELALPLLQVGGWLVAWKGPRADAEVQAARTALRELRGEVVSMRRFFLDETRSGAAGAGRGQRQGPSGGLLGAEARCIVVVAKVGPTPEAFPRRAGTASRRPL